MRNRAQRLLERFPSDFEYQFGEQFTSDLPLALELARCLGESNPSEGLLLEALCLQALGEVRAAAHCFEQLSDIRGLSPSALVLHSALRLLLELPYIGMTPALRDAYRHGVSVVNGGNALPVYVMSAWLLASCRAALITVDYAYVQHVDELLGRPKIGAARAPLSTVFLERARVALYCCEPALMTELLSKVSVAHLRPDAIVLHRVLTLCATALIGEDYSDEGELDLADPAELRADETWRSLGDLALEYPSTALPLEAVWLAVLVGNSAHAPAFAGKSLAGAEDDGLGIALEFDRLRDGSVSDDSPSDARAPDAGIDVGISGDRTALMLALRGRFEASEQAVHGSEQWLWGLLLGVVLPEDEAVSHFDALANTLNSWREADVLLNLGVYIASNELNLVALERRLSPFAWQSLQRYLFDLRFSAHRPFQTNELQLPKLHLIELLSADPQLIGVRADETMNVVALERPFLLTLALVALHGGQMPWVSFEALVAPLVSERAFVYKRGGVTAGERVLSELEFLGVPLLERRDGDVLLRCVSDVDLRGLSLEMPGEAVQRLGRMAGQIHLIERWNVPFGAARFVAHARDVFERALLDSARSLLASLRSLSAFKDVDADALEFYFEYCASLERVLLTGTHAPLSPGQTLN